MQWSSSSIILIISLLLLLIPITANGFINEEKEGENEDRNESPLGQKMRLELVHRHHPRFLGDNGALDQLEAIKGFIKRDTIRRQRMNQRWGLANHHHHHHNSNRRKDYETFQMPMHAGRDYGLGEYFVQVEVGTPGQKFWLVADSGNELTWFNCMHKNRTGVAGGGHSKRQKRKSRNKSRRTRRRRRRTSRSKADKNNNNGVFSPHRSRSFQAVACSSHKCKVDLSDLFSLSYCPRPSDPCLYDISYVDGSSAKGFFGTDTITLDLTNGKKGKLQNLIIGCTRSMLNGVTFNEDTGGILGLGYAKDSFVDKAALQYGGKFSYCLVDHLSHKNVSNYLTFGSSQNVKLLSEIRRTELLLVSPLYGVNVVGISVGGQMLKIPPQVWDFNAQGGTIIDSGTTLTQLVDQAYGPVLEALNKSLTNVKRVSGDFGVLEFCFDGKGFDETLVPRLVFHFDGGARFEPPVKSYIIDAAPQVKCIGIVETTGLGTSVIGNIMQQNHLWEFDLSHNTLGFAPSTCN